MLHRLLPLFLHAILGIFMIGCGGSSESTVIEGERPVYDEAEEIGGNDEVNYDQ